MYLNIILIIILIAVLSWRKVQVIIDRRGWVSFAQFDHTADVNIRFGG